MHYIFLLVSFLSFTSMAIAGEDTIWKSELELGFVQTSGNTHIQTLNSKGNIIAETQTIRTTIKASALNTTDQNNTTAERYRGSTQADWKLFEDDYIFARAGFESDRFAGFNSRTSEALGYGRELIKNDELQWKADLSFGLRQTAFTSNKKTNETVGRASTAITWQINKGTSLSQELDTEGGKEGFVSHSVTALQNKLNDSLSSKISYSLDHTSQVPVGTKKTNIETSITLVWSH